MKNGDFVIAPIDCAEYLTAGKKYQIFDVQEKFGEFLFCILCDEKDTIFTGPKGSSHLNNQDWILATESEAFLKEVKIGYKNITTVSGENLILGSELIDDSFNFVKFVTDTNSNSFMPTTMLNVENPIGEFLEKNGFELISKGVYDSERVRVVLNNDNYAVLTKLGQVIDGIIYSENLNIYWLVGYLTYYNLIDKNYKI